MRFILILLTILLTAAPAKALDEKSNPLRRLFEFSMDRPADTIEEKDNTYKLAIPKKYHEELSGASAVTSPRELKVTLKFQNINTNYTYILFNNQAQKSIDPSVVKNADAIGGVTQARSFSFVKPTGSLTIALPLDKETSPGGQLELTIKTINSMGKTSDPDDAPVKRLTVTLEAARIDYEVSSALSGAKTGVVIRPLDFKPDWKLVRLSAEDKVLDRQTLAKEARGKDLRFDFEGGAGRNKAFRFCLAPRFGYAYADPKVLLDDVICDEVVYTGSMPVKDGVAQELFQAPAAKAEDKPASAAAEPKPEAAAEAGAKPEPRTVDKGKPGMDLGLLKQGKFMRVSLRSDADPGQDTIFLDDREVGATPTPDQAVFLAKDIPLKIAFTRAGQRKWKSYTLAFADGKFKVCHENKCEEYPMNFLEKGVLWLYVKEDRKADFKFTKATD
jgi:hypothetical protein